MELGLPTILDKCTNEAQLEIISFGPFAFQVGLSKNGFVDF